MQKKFVLLVTGSSAMCAAKQSKPMKD